MSGLTMDTDEDIFQFDISMYHMLLVQEIKR